MVNDRKSMIINVKQAVCDRSVPTQLCVESGPGVLPRFPRVEVPCIPSRPGEARLFCAWKTLSIHISFFKWSCFSDTLLHYISFEIWVVKYRYPEVPKGQYRDHLDGQLTNVFPPFNQQLTILLNVHPVQGGDH